MIHRQNFIFKKTRTSRLIELIENSIEFVEISIESIELLREVVEFVESHRFPENSIAEQPPSIPAGPGLHCTIPGSNAFLIYLDLGNDLGSIARIFHFFVFRIPCAVLLL